MEHRLVKKFDDVNGLARIAALSDGVFSIVITLLVFDLKLPATVVPENLAQSIYSLLPKFISYVITFFMIGIYWIGHHSILRHVRCYDRTFLWINLLFLMCVSFLPFPTSVIGAYSFERSSIVLYGLTLICTGGALSAVWSYATRGYRLVETSLSPEIVRIGHQRILFAPAVSCVCILVSLFSPRLSIALFALSGLAYLIPSRIDRLPRQS